jgi:hypothetical protein
VPQSGATCKVTIRGSFDVRWVDYVGDMLLHTQIAEGHVQTTALFGKPPDLAAFIGMLNGLADFGFLVVACEYCSVAYEHCSTEEDQIAWARSQF